MTMRTLASGRIVEVNDAGQAIFLTCMWHVEVPNGNPEPDSRADMYDIVDCGAPMRDGGYGDDTIVCDAGHEFGGMERRYAPFGPEWQREMAEAGR